jgi:hypothetical protein
MALTGRVPFKLYRRLAHGGAGYVASTISAGVTITQLDEQVLSYDGGGSHRDVTLPDVADCKGQMQWIKNHGATNDLVVKNAGGDTIGTVQEATAGLFMSNGVAWIRVI